MCLEVNVYDTLVDSPSFLPSVLRREFCIDPDLFVIGDDIKVITLDDRYEVHSKKTQASVVVKEAAVGVLALHSVLIGFGIILALW